MRKTTSEWCGVLAAAACLVWGVAGCNTAPQMDYSQVELVNVSGTVTLDGEPLPDAVITFESTETGTFSYAKTDSSGGYTLQFDTVKNGCTPGTKVVQISTTRKILGLNSDDEEGGGEAEGGGEGESPDAAAAATEQVPACYNKESRLNVEVTSGSGTFNFDLKSDCSTTGPAA